jgi:MSHA pilin protein MshD
MGARRREQGATLIELIVSIVVVAIAVTSVLGLLTSNVVRSADAMVLEQAVSLAEAYLEEIAFKPFADPDGADGEPARAAFDDVDDYDGLVDSGARDQFGNAIAALAAYTVAVSVTPSAALPSVPAVDAARIDVTVSHPAAPVDISLTAYKTRL